MFDIKIVGSGSDGNCTIIKNADTTVVIDCGLAFKNIYKELDFENPDAVLITHEHCDHANPSAINQFLRRGVDVYMSEGTGSALNLDTHPHLHDNLCACLDTFKVGSFVVFTAPVYHDAVEPLAFRLWDRRDSQKLSYTTDTGALNKGALDAHIVMVECNHSLAKLEASDLFPSRKLRIRANHMSIEKLAWYLKTWISTAVKCRLQEIWLLHVSKKHGCHALFKKTIKEIVPKVKVYVAKEGATSRG